MYEHRQVKLDQKMEAAVGLTARMNQDPEDRKNTAGNNRDSDTSIESGKRDGDGLQTPKSGNRLLVCISPALSSSRVIQEAARTARVLDAEWVALYVEIQEAGALSIADRDRLREHISLVRRLGGEIEHIRGTDVVKEIADYAGRHNITRVVIGKETAFIRAFFRRSTDKVVRLLRMRPDLEVHVVPGEPHDQRIANRRPVWRSHDKPLTAGGILAATLIIAAATGLGLLLSSLGVGEANIIMVFLLAVLMISLISGRLPGMISSVAAVLSFNFFFTSPIGTLLVYDLQYLITFPVMFVVALITSELTTRLHRQARLSMERERRTEILYRTSRSLLSASGIPAVVHTGLEHLRGLMQRDVFCYVPDNEGSFKVYTLPSGEAVEMSTRSPSESAVAAWSFDNRIPAGRGTCSMAGSEVYCHPLVVQDRVLGVVGVVCPAEPLDEPACNLLEAVSAQLALALDRERLAKIEEENRVEIERERLRNTLLQSISHDLRTPLTAIAGAASTLLAVDTATDRETSCELAREILEDATWLTRLVENLLSLTRVEGGAIELSRDLEVAEDLIAGALERFRGRTRDHHVKTFLPENPVLVKVDASLIEQVLINLIDNAIRHTPSGSNLEIRIAYTERTVTFEVGDSGPGFSRKALGHAFERFFTEDPARIERRGLGLGLAICKSIVEAHGGEISLLNRETGGAVVRFTLPRASGPPSHLEEPGDNDG